MPEEGEAGSKGRSRAAALVAHRRRLGLWLREWEADRILAQACAPAWQVDPRAGSGIDAGAPLLAEHHARNPRVGDVWLLRPMAAGSAAERPMYVLVMEHLDGEMLQVAPFGRFASPAVPGEWRTGLRAVPLRVLCLWNIRRVPAAAFRGCWCASRLRGAIVHRALDVWQHVRDGSPLSLVGPEALGPPLVHPRDPRWGYLAAETELWDGYRTVGGVISPFADEDQAGRATSLYDEQSTPLRLAAEAGESYGSRPRRKRSVSERPQRPRD